MFFTDIYYNILTLRSLTNQKDNWPVKKFWVRLNKKQEGPWDLGRSPEND